MKTETTAKHTLGPWKATGWKDTIVNDSDGNTIALFPAGDGRTETAQANAFLIAAAPDMLEALKMIAEMLDAECCDALPPLVRGGCDQVNQAIDAAHAAIAKAEGRQ